MPMFPAMERIKVVVVEAGTRLTQRVTLATSRVRTVTALGPVHDVGETMGAIREARVDLAVVDLDADDAIADVGLLRGAGVRVLVATAEGRAPAIVAALSAGASGLVRPDAAPGSMVDAFRRAVAGELVLEDVYLAELLQHVQQPARVDAAVERFATLTARELQVLMLFARGSSTSDVARALGISRGTVETHVKSVLMKLEVHSLVEAIRFAWREGAVEIPA